MLYIHGEMKEIVMSIYILYTAAPCYLIIMYGNSNHFHV